MSSKGLLQRLNDGEAIIIAEGFMWELERKGYVKFGEYTPEVVLNNPEVFRSLHEEYAHAGSDVVEAFTYLGNRKRLRAIGIEEGLEELNRRALRMAREVADVTGSLMAGDISHTWYYQPEDPKAMEELRAMFKGPLAAIPVPFRCRGKYKTFQSLLDADTGDRLYPDNLSAQLCTRREVREFAVEAKALGVQYIGLCCGNSPAFFREVTDVYGRTTGASEYTTDHDKFLFKTDKKIESHMFNPVE
ncbi:betaine--homocysteine S-methyltransferase 1-like isoform X1 [Argopecten irradians]|uniref:betaine--homocysteine S-methyltransferase 1-like isoform X1 n=1 Tax=Argopecten irradians TaxID=31199 RepID=UPI00371ED062